MTPSRDQQIRTLYRAALERPPADRTSFVADAAGADIELRHSVEELLSQGDATDDRRATDEAAAEHAELQAGTLLGHYRIDGILGRGGMGVVYRATDTKLNRPVAIKFLSVAATDVEAKRRFAQEAATASGLNHPHIVTVHDVGEHDGQQYIVSELVDGGTLDEWSATNRRKGWRHSVELLTGVADALAAAHAAGVLHRDVKPGNILIGRNGYAKLADFGLAKLVDQPRGPAEGVSGRSYTRAGVVVGTIAYMSPEQAAGQSLDARSDVFSFGIVLFELLAGRRPFEAENDLELLKCILHATPPPLPDSVPELLRMAVEKALEKDPADRYQTMRDLVADLRRVARKSTSSQTALSATSDVQIVAAIVKRHRAAAAAVAAAAVIAIGGLYALLGRDASDATTARSGLRDFEITQLTTSGNAVAPAISPDGRYVAYVQVESGVPTSLWVRQVATASNVRVVPSEPGFTLQAPTVTPDGNFVDFIRRPAQFIGGASSLWRVPFLGGTPREVVRGISSPVGWSPSGERMAFVRRNAVTSDTMLVVADADGTNERILATRQGQGFLLSLAVSGQPLARPAWSPDGRVIAVAVFEFTAELRNRVLFIDVATGRETAVDPMNEAFPQGLAWLDPATLVLSQARGVGQRVQLMRMSYPGGIVEPLTNDLSSYLGVDVDGARTNLVTSRRETRISVWAGGAGGAGTQIVPATLFGGSIPQVVWAGERVLFTASVGGQLVIAGVASEGGPLQELGLEASTLGATSDGTTIVFSRAFQGLWKLTAGAREPERLVGGLAFTPIVAPDDRNVIFLSTESGVQSPWIVPLEGGGATEIVRAFAAADSLDISRDGRQLLFITAQEGYAYSFVVCELPACDEPRDVEVPTRGFARFTPDGRGVAYVDAQGVNIWSVALDGGAPRQLTSFADAAAGQIASFAWSRDGERLAIVRMTRVEDIVLLSNLRRD